MILCDGANPDEVARLFGTAREMGVSECASRCFLF